MEIGKIIGYSTKFDYTSKKSGETYPAVNVSVGLESPKFIGVDVVPCFLRVNEESTVYNYEWLDLDVPVIIEYSRRGYVEGIRPADLSVIDDKVSKDKKS